MSRPVDTAEQARILRAAQDGRLRVNEHGRYVIDGEPRPDRRVREQLLQDACLKWPRPGGRRMVITAEGEAALRLLDAPQED
jgi:hypothetical protein